MTQASPTPELGSLVQLEIERLASGGDGVGHVDGRAVFVPLSAPGDLLRVRLTEVRPRYLRAEIERVVRAGPARRTPACRYYGQCGGCDWMHLDDTAQTRARQEILRDALTRIGRLADLPAIETIPSPRSLGYRARARVAYGDGRIGLRARRTHAIVDIDHCVVLDDATQAELTRARRAAPTGDGEIEIRGFGGTALGLRVSDGAFFQANASLWERWADTVGLLCGEGEWAVELYAGVGYFTVGLERAFKRVTAVERGAAAARDLRHNTNAYVCQTSAEAFATAELERARPDLVLLNPPRTGCDRSVIDALRDSAPPRIVYVSCDPPTLARDIARLGDGSSVSRIFTIDALPQTHHIESVVVLDSRRDQPIESVVEG